MESLPFEHVRTLCAAMEMQTLASLRAHASQANANTHARLTRKLRTRRAHASNTHAPPVAMRSSCKRAVLARAVHDHRETNTYPAQVCEHAFAVGEFSTVAPHTRCRTAPHCDRRCSLLRASSLKQREELLKGTKFVHDTSPRSIRENKIPKILTKNIGWIMPPKMNLDAYFLGYIN